MDVDVIMKRIFMSLTGELVDPEVEEHCIQVGQYLFRFTSPGGRSASLKWSLRIAPIGPCVDIIVFDMHGYIDAPTGVGSLSATQCLEGIPRELRDAILEQLLFASCLYPDIEVS